MAETEPTPIADFQCHKCDANVRADWSCCPQCGTWLRPDGPFTYRLLMWFGLLIGLVSITWLLSRVSPEQALVFALIFGLPLCYTFGKAVWFRLTGKPLTYGQLGSTTIRAFFVNVGMFVVLPMMIGIAAFILLFAVCLGAMATGQL